MVIYLLRMKPFATLIALYVISTVFKPRTYRTKIKMTSGLTKRKRLC